MGKEADSMAKAKDQRFKEVYTQGTVSATSVLVDTETGVNYIFHRDGYGGGMTVLLDKEGRPVITPVESKSE